MPHHEGAWRMPNVLPLGVAEQRLSHQKGQGECRDLDSRMEPTSREALEVGVFLLARVRVGQLTRTAMLPCIWVFFGVRT
jgi:hypothetical protein